MRRLHPEHVTGQGLAFVTLYSLLIMKVCVGSVGIQMPGGIPRQCKELALFFSWPTVRFQMA